MSRFASVSCCWMAAAIAILPTIAKGSPSPLPGPAEQAVVNPFADPAALQAFRDYVRKLELKYDTKIDLPPEFEAAAPHMTYWGYTFVPEGETYRVVFSQRYDGSAIIDSVINIVSGIKDGGCSYYSTNNVRVSQVSQYLLRVDADISGKQRTCGDWPWPAHGSWANDIGDISGHATATVTFHVEQTGNSLDRYRGQIVADQPIASVSGNVTSIFGINTNSVGGQILSTALAVPVGTFAFLKSPGVSTAVDMVNVFDSKAVRFSANPQIPITYSGVTDGVVTSKKYREFLQTITGLVWSSQPNFVLDQSGSGFVSSAPYILNLQFGTLKKEYEPIETVYADVEAEINLLRSFGKPDQTVSVVRGDSLSRIARKHYGNSFYSVFIAAANGMTKGDMDHLSTGQVLILPPVYKLPILDGYTFVAPGETLTSICHRLKASDTSACIRAILKTNPGVLRDRIYALDPIRVPQLT